MIRSHKRKGLTNHSSEKTMWGKKALKENIFKASREKKKSNKIDLKQGKREWRE